MAENAKAKVREPVQDRSRDKKNTLLKAGEKLFALKGYRGTNTKDIAREAGVSVGTFYSYFADKADLFLEISENYYEKIFSQAQDLMNTKIQFEKPEHLVPGLIHALYSAHSIQPELHREISIILLQAGNQISREEPDHLLSTTLLRKVEALDRKVQFWLQQQLRLWLPNCGEEILTPAASLIFRVSEETIHRLKQFPDSMEAPDAILNQLVLMLTSYLRALQDNSQTA